ncbi:glycoside hydrolase family 3 N-terminal domain-containing protein [Algivirga pacifica]
MRKILTLIATLPAIAYLYLNYNQSTHKESESTPIIPQTSFTLEDYYTNNPFLHAKVDSIMQSIDSAALSAQVIVTVGGDSGYPAAQIEDMVKEGHVGGVLLLSGEKTQLTNLSKKYDSLSLQNGHLPLIYSADAEPSLVNKKIKGLPKFPNTNTLKTEEQTVATAEAISKELKSMGITHNFAPICDFSINRSIIGNRSFGSDPDTVAKYARIFSEATQGMQVAATAKHFPGHGTVKGDTHKEVVYIDGEMQELPAFQELINSGVLSVMVGHIAVKNNPEFSTYGTPASCSRRIVYDLLTMRMGFQGIIVTDAMNMGAVKNLPNASMKALEAGCHMILMPANEKQLHKKILERMQKDEKFKKHIWRSAYKIIRLKVCLGLL